MKAAINLTAQANAYSNGTSPTLIDKGKHKAASPINWYDHLQRCQEIAKVGSWEADINGSQLNDLNEIFWSDEMYRILGFQPGKVQPSASIFFRLVHPEDISSLNEALKNAMQGEQEFDMEFRLLMPDESIKRIYNKGQIIYKNGVAVRLIGTTQDVTKLRNTNDELAATGKKLKQIFNNMKEIFFTVHYKKHEILFISPSCLQAYGYTQKEFMDDPDLWFKVIVEEDKERIKANTSILEAGNRLEQEYRIYHKDGSVHWLQSVMFPTLDNNGKLYIIDGFTIDITHRKNIEQALKDSEYRFRSLIQNNSDVITILNKDCEVAFVSDSLFKVMGYRPTEITGRRSYDFIYEEDKELVRNHFKKTLDAPGKSLSLEYRRVKKDGTVIWCEGTTINLLHVPEVAGVVLNYRDITKRKQAEQALKDNETKFRSLIQNSSDGILIINKENIIVFASDSYYKMSGYTPAEVIGQSSYSFIHPEDQERIKFHKQIILDNPELTYQITYRRRCKNGEYMWVEGATTNMIHRPEVNGIILNLRNITERIQAEEAVKNSEYKLKALISQSSDAITITDKNLKFTFANESLFRMSGYEKLEEFSLDLVHPDDVIALKQYLKWLLEHPNEIKEITFRIRKKDGSYMWAERVSINKLNDPVINGIITNFRDITERKLYIETLLDTNEELKKRNMELDNFVYRVSHDLRAPLLSVLGLIELSENEGIKGNVAEYLGMMKESIQKLDCFINDILNYSRNCRSEVKEDRINLKEDIAGIISQLKFTNASTEKIEFENNIDETVSVMCDKQRLNVIFTNLISNAIRYRDTSISNPFIRIHSLHEKDKLVINVEDNGIGISPEYHARIFEMFFRASSRSTGTGLGLYIVKETVEKLGGSVKLLSAPGKGTTFSVILPYKH